MMMNDIRRLPATVILLAVLISNAHAESQIPMEFQGTWKLDVDATTKAVESDQDLPAGMLREWQGFTESIIQYDRTISENTIGVSMRVSGRDEQRDGVPERGLYQVEFDGEQEGALVFVMRSDPRHCPSGCSPEQQVFFHLRLRDDGSLQVRERRMKGWDNADPLFQHFVFRNEAKMSAPPAGTNNAVAYLDGLKTCTPGEHRFSYASLGDFENTILGQGETGCKVTLVTHGVRLTCEFSAETIELLTRPEKYEDARNGVLQGSTDSEESARLNQECDADAS